MLTDLVTALREACRVATLHNEVRYVYQIENGWKVSKRPIYTANFYAVHPSKAPELIEYKSR
jgi:hypothetical protein